MSGCTCASDHHYLFPAGLEEAMDVQAEEAGARRHPHDADARLAGPVEGRTAACADSVVQDEDTILADCERVLGRYHDPRDGAMLQVALAPCAPFNVSQAADGRDARRSPRSTIAGCTPISSRHATRTNIACDTLRHAGRSTISRSAAG